MWLVWLGVGLWLLRFFGVEPVASVHWGWLLLPFVLAFLWFDFIEERLGINKRKAFDELDRSKKSRIRRAQEHNKRWFQRK